MSCSRRRCVFLKIMNRGMAFSTDDQRRQDQAAAGWWLGWRDLALFRILKTYTFLSIRYVFMRSILKNWQLGPRAMQFINFKFFFYFYFLENQQKPSLYINNNKNIEPESVKKNFFKITPPQLWQHLFQRELTMTRYKIKPYRYSAQVH